MAPNLLILTDFFAGANRALDYATNLAEPLGARLVLLHVHRASLLDPERFTGKLSNLGPEDMTLALNSLTRQLAVPVVAELGVGQVEDVVRDAVERHHPALIVLSRPQDSPTPDELVTTTALNLLRTSPYPLLVVPPAAPATTPPKRVALAADGGKFSLGASDVDAMRHLLSALHAELTVVHVTESATRHTAQQARESVEHTGLTRDLPAVHTCHVCQAEPAEGLMDAVREQQADLLVVIARPHTLLGRLFHRSVTARLVLHSPVPVLVLSATDSAKTQR
ncbi:universal stress protein [Hymenobacter cavernae]|uniref:UspA domain-containing protein n=1 Tax=Hymenobacter cavernae TaxID=2044852 RepID=A0ABQ1UBU2_9BACT|nr:universal stress protein [Hymenobacter cavernae]GGF15390.1 hypothetical protein GCM10011383_28340 [Hymenobacter cavernae]